MLLANNGGEKSTSKRRTQEGKNLRCSRGKMIYINKLNTCQNFFFRLVSSTSVYYTRWSNSTPLRSSKMRGTNRDIVRLRDLSGTVEASRNHYFRVDDSRKTQRERPWCFDTNDSLCDDFANRCSSEIASSAQGDFDSAQQDITSSWRCSTRITRLESDRRIRRFSGSQADNSARKPGDRTEHHVAQRAP